LDVSAAEFISRWPEVSTQLSALITGQPYSSLTPDGKMDLSKLLFVASLADTTTTNVFDMVKTGNQAIILYGPPGTGKTYRAQEVVKHLLGTQDLAASNFSKMFNRAASSAAGSTRAASDSDDSANLRHSGCWELIQFHPNYSYHDFIGGIMPELTGDKLGYAKNEGIFKRFCDAANAHRPKPFVLIIDEINRADLSSVFGELMYALEYRNKAINILQFGAFEIPDNVFVIGTMNSADKSLVTFDLALRRRFLFFKLLPDMNVLHDWNAKREKDGKPPINDEDLALLIGKAKRLNSALIGNGATELGLPEDYGIGQAYFMKIADFCVIEAGASTERNEARITEFSREQLWIYHLEPLLEEYLGAEAGAKKNDLRALRDDFVKSS
jgi:DNA polymerase III delta prime subunit